VKRKKKRKKEARERVSGPGDGGGDVDAAADGGGESWVTTVTLSPFLAWDAEMPVEVITNGICYVRQ
jgi:hypothetical protein